MKHFQAAKRVELPNCWNLVPSDPGQRGDTKSGYNRPSEQLIVSIFRAVTGIK